MKWYPKGEYKASGEDRGINPAIGDPPAEFVEIDSTELERDLELVLYAADTWAHSSPDAQIDWGRSDRLTSAQVETQDWGMLADCQCAVLWILIY